MCSNKFIFIISKDELKCSEPPASNATPAKDFTYYRMSMTLCREICQGEGHDYAVVQSDRCRCYSSSDVENLAAVPLSECGTPCPTNKYQRCGGSNHVMAIHSGECTV